MVDGRSALRFLLGFLIDYLRWTQLLPMLAVWGVAFLMILALLVAGREQAIFDGAMAALAWLYTLPWLGEYLSALAEADGGTLKLSGADIQSLLSWGWLGTSLLFAFGGLVAGWLCGPFAPWRYRTRMLLVVLVTVLVAVGFFVALVAGSEEIHSGSGDWLPTVVGVTLLVLVVGAWCQTAAHMLGALKGLLETALDDGESASSGP